MAEHRSPKPKVESSNLSCPASQVPYGGLGCSRFRHVWFEPLDSISSVVLRGSTMGRGFVECPIPASARSFTQFGPLARTTPWGPLAPELGPSDRAARPVTLRIAHQSYTTRWDSIRTPALLSRSGSGLIAIGRMRRTRPAVPSKHRFGLDDQERCRPARAVHGIAEQGQDRAVGFVEPRLADLALQHEDLVTERKNLSVAGATGRKYPADSSENEACERGNQGHKSSTLPIPKETRNPQDHWADDFSARTGLPKSGTHWQLSRIPVPQSRPALSPWTRILRGANPCKILRWARAG